MAPSSDDGKPKKPEDDTPDSPGRRQRLKTFLKGEIAKGKTEVQQALGLGHRPNVIPAGPADIKGAPRTVELGWHPVAGFAGKWFAEQTGLGRMITEKTHNFPDPTQHWAILVGDYCHQLWMDENLDVIYINEKLERSQWTTYEVGKTRFSDEALRQAGEMSIFQMREKQPAYNLISNNCQLFAMKMLKSIVVGKHKEFATSFEVYRAAVGPGAIVDLFKMQADELPAPEEEAKAEEEPEHVVENAQKVMDHNTTKLDDHESDSLWKRLRSFEFVKSSKDKPKPEQEAK